MSPVGSPASKLIILRGNSASGKSTVAAEYGEAEMSAWYRELDLLPGGTEQVIPASTALNDAVQLIMADTLMLALWPPAGGPTAIFSVARTAARRSSSRT